jgi:hypothetical protein
MRLAMLEFSGRITGKTFCCTTICFHFRHLTTNSNIYVKQDLKFHLSVFPEHVNNTATAPGDRAANTPSLVPGLTIF